MLSLVKMPPVYFKIEYYLVKEYPLHPIAKVRLTFNKLLSDSKLFQTVSEVHNCIRNEKEIKRLLIRVESPIG